MDRKNINRQRTQLVDHSSNLADFSLIIKGQENFNNSPRRASMAVSVISKEDIAYGLNDSPVSDACNSFAKGPLTEVKQFQLREITPSECPKSSNPSIKYFFERAYASSEALEYQAAIKMYRKVLACDSEHFESFINLGICMIHLKKYNEAIQSFDSASKVNTHSFIPYFNKALCFLSIQNYSAALACMDSASEMFPDPPEELQKIRTYAIFKCGKVPSVNSGIKLTESFVAKQAKPDNPANETPERWRRMSIPNEEFKEKRILYPLSAREPGFIEVEDIDSRNITTTQSSLYIRSQQTEHLPTISTVRIHAKRNVIQKYSWKKYMREEFFQPKKKVTLKNILSQAQDKDLLTAKKIKEKLLTMEDKIIETVVRRIEIFFQKPGEIGKNQLTVSEVAKLQCWFDNVGREFDNIDHFFKEFEFCREILKELRRPIFEMGRIVRVAKGDVLFGHGEVADRIFWMLRGKLASIIDRETADLIGGINYSYLSRKSTLQQRLALPIRYLATCRAEEESFMLSLPTKEYQFVLSDSLKEEIEEKACFLSNLQLFKGIDPTLLILLILHSEKQIAYESEVILQKREVPKGLIIIFSGYCGLYTSKIVKDFQQKSTRRKSVDFQEKVQKKQRFSNPLPGKMQKTVGELKKVEYGLLRFGDYIGGRVILEGTEETGSKFSVTAISREVEMIIVTKKTLIYLPEKLAIHLKAQLQKRNDIDCPPYVKSQN